MPRIKLTGLDEVIAQVKVLSDGDGIEKVQKRVAYVGMSVLLKEVIKQINKLPVQAGYIEGDKLPRDVITPVEKKDLIKHIGIARMDNKDGTVSTSLSFEGYSTIKTTKYPKGVPMPLIARSICSGSSVRRKHPFIRSARSSGRKKAISEATKEAQEMLRKMIEEKG